MMQRLLIAALLAAGPILVSAAGAAPSGAVKKEEAPKGEAPKGKAPKGNVPKGKEMHADIAAPLFSEAFAAVPVATVDDEVITLQQLMSSLSQAHQGRKDSASHQGDFRPVLERLIDLKLCVLEAIEMGLDERPEVKDGIRDYDEELLLGQLTARATKDLKPDQAVVDRNYRDAVREWKLRSLLFEKEADAKAFQAAVAGGQGFEVLAKQLVADKKAKGTPDASYVSREALLPQVLQAIGTAGVTAPTVVNVSEGWSVIQVLDVRYPENPEARASAEAASVEAQRAPALKKFYEGLVKKYARVNRKLVDSLHFEAPKPGFKELRKDGRVVARIAGEKPLTVADLAHGIEKKFFHGIEGPIKEHKVDEAKLEVLDKLLQKRLTLKEAGRLQIAATDDYRRLVAENRDATLFSSYLERVVMPDVKVTEKEGQDYYAQHKAEFTTPAMYKLDALTFASAKTAQAALDKLRAGTDYKWLRANAEGQVKEDQRVAKLDGAVLSATTLPPDLAKALSGSKPGDYRLHEQGGQYFVLHVVSETPASEQPYPQARGAIGKKLVNENLGKAIQSASAKLRAAHEVNVYITKLGY